MGTGTYLITDGFTSEQPDCTVTYSLIEEGKNTYDTAIFDFTSSSAVIKINTDDINLHLVEKTLILRAVSVDSGSFAQQIFTVTFLNGCNDVILSAAVWDNSTGRTLLYQVDKFYF